MKTTNMLTFNFDFWIDEFHGQFSSKFKIDLKSLRRENNIVINENLIQVRKEFNVSFLLSVWQKSIKAANHPFTMEDMEPGKRK